MWGLVAHHGAAGAKIVCVGTFTKDAAAFAAGKSIELITGEALLALVKDVQSSPERQTAAPADRTTMRTEPAPSPSCPHCGKGMVARNNKTTRDPFWGCSSYPRCRGTLPV
jgi:restriction system protein